LMNGDIVGAAVLVPATYAGFSSLNLFSSG
jgi:hypothetical protein